MKACPEGTYKHGRLSADGREVQLIELHHMSRRFQELQQFITANLCDNAHCICKNIVIKRAIFITGHFLGTTGMVGGPKTTLFHGCSDDVVEKIGKQGFDDKFSGDGKAFGPGLYFSPQPCKAFSYAQSHLLVCEVALGRPEDRLTVTAPDSSLCYEEVFKNRGYRSVQCLKGRPFFHEERVVYRPTQCKPVYIIETMTKSPGGGW